MLVELEAVPASALPVAEFTAHLRLGTGFSTEGLQDALLQGHLRAALAAIEGRIGKALLQRPFRLELAAWRDHGAGQALPIAPVSAVSEVALVDAAGARVALPAASWRLRRDTHRPRLQAVSGTLPPVPAGGRAEVLFDAGFGSGWSTIPADLRQSVLLLASEFYEHRHDGGSSGLLPGVVQGLIEPWRIVRVLGGGGA